MNTRWFRGAIAELQVRAAVSWIGKKFAAGVISSDLEVNLPLLLVTVGCNEWIGESSKHILRFRGVKSAKEVI